MEMTVTQHNAYTVYGNMDWRSDVLIRANECKGAEVVFLAGNIEEQGEFLGTMDITEEQYQDLRTRVTKEQVLDFFDNLKGEMV